ncbi:hypothetical protein METH_17460 [Leisingera methylohalidivorans DSM 14336]|uniref:Uncharacterized protein n=1 Tax=Leisingera methylohalidivorans DSM 14336 TaxID=999552 RepID=V9VWW2_9RHOB|nr:hypothetical protein METH_17460 [Leisingera methylohalidivorans DSM 14336]
MPDRMYLAVMLDLQFRRVIGRAILGAACQHDQTPAAGAEGP